MSMMVLGVGFSCFGFFFFKQKTAYEMRISDWSSDVCSSDLADGLRRGGRGKAEPQGEREGVESAVRGHGRCSFVWHGASLAIGDELRVIRAYSCSGSVVGGWRARVLTAVRAIG